MQRKEANYKEQVQGVGVEGRRAQRGPSEQHGTPFFSHFPLILKLDSNGALIQHKKVFL